MVSVFSHFSSLSQEYNSNIFVAGSLQIWLSFFFFFLCETRTLQLSLKQALSLEHIWNVSSPCQSLDNPWRQMTSQGYYLKSSRATEVIIQPAEQTSSRPANWSSRAKTLIFASASCNQSFSLQYLFLKGNEEVREMTDVNKLPRVTTSGQLFDKSVSLLVAAQ